MIKSNWKICLLDYRSVIIDINQLRRKKRDCQCFEENSCSQIPVDEEPVKQAVDNAPGRALPGAKRGKQKAFYYFW